MKLITLFCNIFISFLLFSGTHFYDVEHGLFFVHEDDSLFLFDLESDEHFKQRIVDFSNLNLKMGKEPNTLHVKNVVLREGQYYVYFYTQSEFNLQQIYMYLLTISVNGLKNELQEISYLPGIISRDSGKFFCSKGGREFLYDPDTDALSEVLFIKEPVLELIEFTDSHLIYRSNPTNFIKGYIEDNEFKVEMSIRLELDFEYYVDAYVEEINALIISPEFEPAIYLYSLDEHNLRTLYKWDDYHDFVRYIGKTSSGEHYFYHYTHGLIRSTFWGRKLKAEDDWLNYYLHVPAL